MPSKSTSCQFNCRQRVVWLVLPKYLPHVGRAAHPFSRMGSFHVIDCRLYPPTMLIGHTFLPSPFTTWGTIIRNCLAKGTHLRTFQ